MELTELEKQKVITCINYIENNYRIDRYKLELEYDKLDHYDEELDKKIEQAIEREEFYSNLVEKLKVVLQIN